MGYGFDNIGDVLTLPPLLMEKYLSAAEQIAAKAIGEDKPGNQPAGDPDLYRRIFFVTPGEKLSPNAATAQIFVGSPRGRSVARSVTRNLLAC